MRKEPEQILDEALDETFSNAVPSLPSAPVATEEFGLYRVEWGSPEDLRIEFDYVSSERRTGEIHAEVRFTFTDALEGRPIHQARLNLSSTQSKDRLAAKLAKQFKHRGINWDEALEWACQWVINRYRSGEPGILLRDALDDPDLGQPLIPPLLTSDGITIIFGDGGSGKSYVSLALALSLHTGDPVIEGLEPRVIRRVAYLDWEWSARVHRRRMVRLLGDHLPDIAYLPCRLPIREERDRIRAFIREKRIDYVVIDSVALAAGNEPEAAETAIQFFNTVRELGVDALGIAHVTNQAARTSADRPFGSAYWHNSARSTWYLRRTAEDPVTGAFRVGLSQKKANEGRLHPTFGVEFSFDENRTYLRAVDWRDDPDLADQVPIKARLVDLLKHGPLKVHEIADVTGIKPDTVRRTLDRYTSHFGKTMGDDRTVTYHLIDRTPAPAPVRPASVAPEPPDGDVVPEPPDDLPPFVFEEN